MNDEYISNTVLMRYLQNALDDGYGFGYKSFSKIKVKKIMKQIKDLQSLIQSAEGDK